MESRSRGFFALVSYVPSPLGSVLDELRRSLPGHRFPQAHVTILPPRPLEVSIQEASDHARQILDQYTAFDIEFGEVQHFPETQFLYLDLGLGANVLHDLHEALNTNGLAYQEQFEFRPHLTLGGPIPTPILEKTKSQISRIWNSIQLSRAFRMTHAVALWGSPDGVHIEWTRLWTYAFLDGTSVGAGAGR